LEKHSININIFGRQFPARVDREEAAVIKEAAQLIDKKMRDFKTEYKTQDDVDIAIMCCLEIMTVFLKEKNNDARNLNHIQDELEALDQKLDHTIQLLHSA